MANKTKILSAAQKHIQRGNYDRAIRELRKLVEEDPRDVRTLLKIGDLFTKKGSIEEATETYQQVAEFYSEQGFFLKAVAVYKTVMKHDPTNIEVANKLAELYEHLGLVQEAMGQFQSIALLHEQGGSARQALDALARMVDLDSNNISARVRLAEAYSKQEMLTDAAREFSEAAEALREQDRIADYIKVAERLVYHAPERTDVIKDLARVYLQHHDTKRALAKLQLAFQLVPDDIETLTMLASAFHDAGEVAKTLFVYRELIKAYNSQNKTNEAMVIYQRILEIQPDDQEAKNALGLVPKPPSLAPTKRSTERKTVEPQSSEVSTSDPDVDKDKQENVEKLLTETEVYVKYGLHKKAVEHLNKILEIDPKSIKVYTKLVEIHEKANETEEAAKAYVNIIRLNVEMSNGAGAQKARAALGKLQADHPATDPNFNFEQGFEEDFEVDMSTGAFDVAELERQVEDPSNDGIEINFGEEENTGEEDEFFEVSNFDLDFDLSTEGDGVVTFENETNAEKSTISFDASGSPLESAEALDSTDLNRDNLIGATMETPIAELPSAAGEKMEVYESDLDVADAFLEQGLFIDARNLVSSILDKAPSYSRAVEMQTRLNLLSSDQANEEMGNAITEAISVAQSGDLNLPSGISSGEPISENDSFMTLAEDMTDADEVELESRFDLALAYREMGMLEEAIVEFQIASQAPAKTLESYIQIGRCFVEQGDSISAVGYFFNAIDSGASEELATELKYEIGSAYETANDVDLALHWFETVQEENPNFKDVVTKIQALGAAADDSSKQVAG